MKEDFPAKGSPPSNEKSLKQSIRMTLMKLISLFIHDLRFIFSMPYKHKYDNQYNGDD